MQTWKSNSNINIACCTFHDLVPLRKIFSLYHLKNRDGPRCILPVRHKSNIALFKTNIPYPLQNLFSNWGKSNYQAVCEQDLERVLASKVASNANRELCFLKEKNQMPPSMSSIFSLEFHLLDVARAYIYEPAF
jgi:hypothetical protein